MEETKLKPCPFCGGTKIFVGSVAEIELMDKYDYLVCIVYIYTGI